METFFDEHTLHLVMPNTFVDFTDVLTPLHIHHMTVVDTPVNVELPMRQEILITKNTLWSKL